LLEQLSKIEPVSSHNEDGTAIGYAIFKTVNLIAATRHYAQDLVGDEKPSYEIKSALILILTDGFQQPNPQDKGNHLRNMDLEEAAEYARDNHVRVYVINVDPSANSPEFEPQRTQLQQITRLTGGNFFMLHDTTSLNQLYSQIDRLEKSKIPEEALLQALPRDKQPENFRRVSLFPWLIGIGMACLMGSILLQTLIFRRVP